MSKYSSQEVYQQACNNDRRNGNRHNTADDDSLQHVVLEVLDLLRRLGHHVDDLHADLIVQRIAGIGSSQHQATQQERTYFELPWLCAGKWSAGWIFPTAYQRYEPESRSGTRQVLLPGKVNIIDLALRDSTVEISSAHPVPAGRPKSNSRRPCSAGLHKDGRRFPSRAVIGARKEGASAGVLVSYSVTFTFRERTLLKGDPHVHSNASDGAFSREQLLAESKKIGLDFFFLTDHNNYAHNSPPMEYDHVCLFPGSEWTHYDGHAGMLGVCRPLRSPFCVNSAAGAWEKLDEARQNGALVILNHPFCPTCGWHFGLEGHTFDLIEVWNGHTVPAGNQACLAWWRQQLCTGKRLPVIGGSDFHRILPGLQLGSPTTAVYAMSRSMEDILAAMRQGNCYLLAAPDGPDLWAEADGAILGETAAGGSCVTIRLSHLSGDETLRMITDLGQEEAACPPRELTLSRAFPRAGFVRFELRRGDQLILLSNPIYFQLT